MPHKKFEELLDSFDPGRGVQNSRTPPYTWYTDPVFFDKEVAVVFQKAWIPVGRLDQVKNVGDYFTGEVVGNPFVVVRTEDGLKAHHNVCRHKGMIVAQECGNCPFFECTYHGWQYRHDGSLKSAPRLGPQKSFDKDRYGLQPVCVDTWGPLVFLDFDGPFGGAGNPRDLQRDVAPLKELLEPRFEKLRCEPSLSKIYELNCNWKVFADNSLDGGLHVEYIHGDTLGSSLESCQLETHCFQDESGKPQGTSIQIGKTTGKDERLGDKVMYAFIYPNLFLNLYGSMMDVNIIEPIAVDRCRVRFDFYFDFENFDDWATKQTMRRDVARSHLIQDEDIDVCNEVQTGMKSMTWRHGRYSSTYEKAVYEFHRLLYADLRGHRE